RAVSRQEGGRRGPGCPLRPNDVRAGRRDHLPPLRSAFGRSPREGEHAGRAPGRADRRGDRGPGRRYPGDAVRARGLLALAGVAALAISGGGSASTPRGWQTILVTKAQGVFPIGWAAGRVWFVVEANGAQDDFTLYSARVGSGGLTSIVPTP